MKYPITFSISKHFPLVFTTVLAVTLISGCALEKCSSLEHCVLRDSIAIRADFATDSIRDSSEWVSRWFGLRFPMEQRMDSGREINSPAITSTDCGNCNDEFEVVSIGFSCEFRDRFGQIHNERGNMLNYLRVNPMSITIGYDEFFQNDRVMVTMSLRHKRDTSVVVKDSAWIFLR